MCRFRVVLSFEILDDARGQRGINHRLLILPIINVKDGTENFFDLGTCVTRGQWPPILIQSGLYL